MLYICKSFSLLLLLVFCNNLAVFAENKKSYTIVPEVQYAKLLISGRHVGYWRDEYKLVDKGRYSFEHEDKVFLPGIISIRKNSWVFDEILRPISFMEEDIDEASSKRMTKTVDGRIDYDKKIIIIKKRISGEQYYSETEVPLPEGLISDGASDIILANEPFSPGRKFTFKTFVPRIERDDELTVTVREKDDKTGASWIDMKSRENPNEQMEILFQQVKEGTPNGRVLKGILKGGGMVLEVIASSREEALGTFEGKSYI